MLITIMTVFLWALVVIAGVAGVAALLYGVWHLLQKLHIRILDNKAQIVAKQQAIAKNAAQLQKETDAMRQSCLETQASLANAEREAAEAASKLRIKMIEIKRQEATELSKLKDADLITVLNDRLSTLTTTIETVRAEATASAEAATRDRMTALQQELDQARHQLRLREEALAMLQPIANLAKAGSGGPTDNAALVATVSTLASSFDDLRARLEDIYMLIETRDRPVTSSPSAISRPLRISKPYHTIPGSRPGSSPTGGHVDPLEVERIKADLRAGNARQTPAVPPPLQPPTALITSESEAAFRAVTSPVIAPLAVPPVVAAPPASTTPTPRLPTPRIATAQTDVVPAAGQTTSAEVPAGQTVATAAMTSGSAISPQAGPPSAPIIAPAATAMVQPAAPRSPTARSSQAFDAPILPLAAPPSRPAPSPASEGALPPSTRRAVPSEERTDTQRASDQAAAVQDALGSGATTPEDAPPEEGQSFQVDSRKDRW